MTPTYNIHSSTPPHSTVSSLHNPHQQEAPSLRRKNELLPWVFEKSILTWLPPSSSLTGSSEKCIQLIRKAGDYRARIIDYLFFIVNKEISILLRAPLLGEREEVIVNYLKNWTVSEQGDFQITTRFSGYPDKRYGNQRITIRSNQGHPVWFLYDSIENSVSWLNASVEDSRILRGIPEGERGAFFENYTVKIVAKNGRLRDIFLSRNSGPCTKSKLDPFQSISEDFWAITLISSGRSSETDKGCGHAKIIFETFQRGIHSVFYAHLSAIGAPPGHAKVSTGEIRSNTRRIEWRKKSTTWIKPRRHVDRMIKEIQLETNTLLPFTPTGNPSLFTYPYNEVVRLLSPTSILRKYLRSLSGAVITEFIARMGFATLGVIDIRELFLVVSGMFLAMEEIFEARKIARSYSFRIETRCSLEPLAYNCLTWAAKKIRLAEVRLPLITDIVAIPDIYIDSLRELEI